MHSDSARPPTLEWVIYPGDSPVVHALPHSGRVSVGRAATNDIVIDDASVSRQHATLHIDMRVWVEDLGSANGTRLRQSVNSLETVDLLGPRLPVRERVEVQIGQTIQIGSVTTVVRRSSAAGRADATVDGVVVRDSAMQKLHELAARVAAAPLSVLLLGETGVGKEVFAEQIHRLSPRASKPLVKLNCAAFSETLIESELFGHERGAFTGAVHAKPGLFEAAEAGTVFLDEVGELPPTAQAKLLRVLEDRKVLRIGALRPHPVDFRVIAATNRDLDAAVAQGGFRQDLLFRLNGVSLVIPALRDRVGEIIPLAERFATRASKQLARPHPPRLSVETIRALEQHPWRGNVRELRNVIDRAVVLAPRDVIEPEHLMFTPAVAASLPGSAPTKYPPAGSNDATSERDRIISALQRCGGNQTRAATDLGISRRTLVNRLEEYGITRPRKSSG